MNDIMYQVPSEENIEKCIITKDTVNGTGKPEYIYKEDKNTDKKSTKKKENVG